LAFEVPRFRDGAGAPGKSAEALQGGFGEVKARQTEQEQEIADLLAVTQKQLQGSFGEFKEIDVICDLCCCLCRQVQTIAKRM
jgi:hypothetical protein